MTLKSPLNAALDSRKHPATQHCRKLVKKLNNWNLQLYINLYSFTCMKEQLLNIENEKKSSYLFWESKKVLKRALCNNDHYKTYRIKKVQQHHSVWKHVEEK